MIRDHVISWKSTLTGKEGQGVTPLFYGDAAEQCRRLNKEFPGVEHKPKPAPLWNRLTAH